MHRGDGKMNYAMVLLGRVIDVLKDQNEKPCWPPDQNGNPVTAVPCDDTVTVGMVYDAGTEIFSKPVLIKQEIPPRLPTPEEAMQAKLDYIMMMAE